MAISRTVIQLLVFHVSTVSSAIVSKAKENPVPLSIKLAVEKVT